MSMTESLFDIRRESTDLFTGRKILEDHPDFCWEWMNQYPFLFFTFKISKALINNQGESRQSERIARLFELMK